MNTKSAFTSKDLVKLQGSALLLVVLIASGLGLVYWEHRQKDFAQIKVREAEARHAGVETKLQRVNFEEQEIKAKTALFKQLEARRVVGPERRLDWVETINTIIARRKLFAISYEISPQQALGVPSGPFQFGVSTMKFRLPLLHENDLSRFLAELRLEAPAIVQVDQCRMDRAAQGGDTAQSAGLQSDCTLRWITLQDTRPGAKK